MDNSARQNILKNIETTLKNNKYIKEVEIDRASIPDLESLSLPCAFVYSDKEHRDTTITTMGCEGWLWGIAIEVWARGDDLETILKSIHGDMYNNGNYKRGGYANNSYRTGVEFFYIDPEEELKGMLITYDVQYDNPNGDM